MHLPSDHIAFQAETTINKLLMPLKKMSNINYFSYGVNYHDSRVFTLTTNAQYYKTWFDNLFPFCGFHLKEGWHLWENTLPKEQLEIGNAFNIENGINFIRHHDSKTEIFSFGTSRENKAIYDFYLNHHSVLKKFNNYFINEAQEVIHRAQSHLILPPKSMINGQYPINAVKEDMHFDFFDYPLNMLSKREAECYQYLLKGYSNVEIGQRLDISSKTVDIYVLRLKQKLGCNSRSELVSKAIEMGLLELSV